MCKRFQSRECLTKLSIIHIEILLRLFGLYVSFCYPVFYSFLVLVFELLQVQRKFLFASLHRFLDIQIQSGLEVTTSNHIVEKRRLQGIYFLRNSHEFVPFLQNLLFFPALRLLLWSSTAPLDSRHVLVSHLCRFAALSLLHLLYTIRLSWLVFWLTLFYLFFCIY